MPLAITVITAKLIVEIVALIISLAGFGYGLIKGLGGVLERCLDFYEDLIDEKIEKSEERIEKQFERIFDDFYQPLKKQLFEIHERLESIDCSCRK